MNEHFQSLDETVRAIRAECETRVKAAEDKLLAAEIEATMAKDQLNRALLAKEDAIQVACRLIEQFGVAEEAFAKAKKYALIINPPELVANHPLLPNIDFERAAAEATEK